MHWLEKERMMHWLEKERERERERENCLKWGEWSNRVGCKQIETNNNRMLSSAATT